MLQPRLTRIARALRLRHVLATAVALTPAMVSAIDLADSPLFSTVTVPGNLILALSVEWPTATTPAYPSTTAYDPASTFLGYFDPGKCYQYNAINTGTSSSPDYSTSYFKPVSTASSHACTSSSSQPLWSGNYLNWASMQTLDAFRWVLTGGYRSVDDTDKTILTKTYAAKDSGVMPQKTLASSNLDGATPFKSAVWTNGATTRLRKLGTRMWIASDSTASTLTGSATTGATPYTDQNSYVGSSDSHYADPSATYELYINVKVCDNSSASLPAMEDNCTAYANNKYKPEGLMQTYSSKLRYSAFGYYNDSSNSPYRDGGVMRARMKYIGPTQPIPGSASVGNSYAEWDATTGVMSTNPDSADASATEALATAAGFTVSISNSGVMNYLNKFGNFAHSYKSYDPVSELYYSALRYYKNLGNVPSYTSLAAASNSATATTWLDGFPAITSDDVWKKSASSNTASYGSPILYSCQKNFILGIGDVNTWQDSNLPGSTLTDSGEPTRPSEVTADTSVDVKVATDMVGQLEGSNTSSSTLGARYVSSSRKDTYFVAGLAYDSHTKDIRSDLTGTQTVNTYWMDVLENQVYLSKNEYWLAAKYGGFTVPTGFSPYASSNGTSTLAENTWYTNTDTLSYSGGSDKRPDNYFPGNQPDAMKSGLTKAFAKIVSETSAATATALSTASPNVTSSGNISYASTYNPKDWTGQLIASTVTYAGDGTPTATAVWDARDQLETLVSASSTSSRKIVTCCKSDGSALPFTATDLSGNTLISRTNYASFSNVPGVSTQSAANFVSYLRGATGQEIANGGVYRTRTYRLGDIVNSKPIAVAGPSATYYDANNPGYSTFKKSYASRKTVVYVGANDGMLHAIDGTTGGSTSGKELFAYVPSFAYGSTNTIAAASGLASLGNPSYNHHYFVDATPQVFDVDLGRAATGSASAAAVTTNWRSLLIGGMGKGGNGYFAIDVTDPTAWTDETAVAGKVLWEFTDSRMGYSYGSPSVIKTKKYGWVVVFTSGYNNSDGKGWFFFVSASTGALLEAVSTSEGSTSAPLNMAHHTAFIPDYTDFTADAIYAGDMQGNVWRLDVSNSSGDYAAPVKIATLTNANGDALPVTTRPLTEIEPNSKKRYIMLGTGRLLADSDISGTSLQSFYAIVDGTSTFGSFFATGGGGQTFPFGRGMLEANTNLLTGIGSAPTSSLGWYFDLSASSSNSISERVDVQPTANNGVVAFAANLPSGDACNPTGTARTFAVNFATGKTAMTDTLGTSYVASLSSTTVIRDIAFQRVGGKLRLYTGNSGGSIVKVPSALGNSGSLKQISWREIKPAE